MEQVMLIDIYVWSWIHLHPVHVRRVITRFLLLSALILAPLLLLNITLVKRGFSPQTPSLEINLNQANYPGDSAEQ
jgi:hypothetical protein